METRKFEMMGSEVRVFLVKDFGGSGHIIIPKKFIGKRVAVVFPAAADLPAKKLDLKAKPA